MTTSPPTAPAIADGDGPPHDEPTPPSTLLVLLGGVLAAVAALGVAELAASLSNAWQSPVVSVGNRVVEFVPEPVKQFAIRTFGEDDKIALFAGIGALLVVYAAVLGLVARRDVRRGIAGVALFGVVGAAAALADAGAGIGSLLPTVAGTSAGVAAVWALFGHGARVGTAGDTAAHATIGEDRAREGDGDEPPEATGATDRRGFLRVAGVVGVAGVAAGGLGRVLARRFAVAVEDARAALSFPIDPSRINLPIPEGVNPVDGVTPFVTDNADFYRVDINLTVPQVDPANHRLRVTGMVDTELDLSMQDLFDLPSVEVPITLTCVSNQVGGDLAGNAVWQGVLLGDLLERAGVQDAATQVVGRSVDDYTAGFPVEAAFDRDAIVAYAMNGEPLPAEHGFPVRLVVPGLYGYTSATKWLEEIELTTFQAFEDYWVSRDWTPGAPIRTFSRIDTPAGFGTPAGDVVIAGVAWAQQRGIDRVEVRVDDGDWQDAELHAVPSVDTWRQWTLPFTFEPGSHSIEVRATDGDGETQPEERRPPKPDGVTGWQRLTVQFTEGDA